jgi:hypothetical protein
VPLRSGCSVALAEVARICGGVVQDAGGAGRKGDSSLIRPRACLDSSRGGWGLMAAIFGFIAQDGFGEYRPVRELAADVVFRESIAPKAYRRGGLRRVLASARRVSSAGTGLAPVPQAKSLHGAASRPSRCGRRLRLAPGEASGS